MNKFVLLLLSGLFFSVHGHAMTRMFGNKLCNLDEKGGTFTVLDNSTQESRKITTAKGPIHFTVANNYAYIVCRADEVLTVLDLTTFDQKHIKCVDPVSVCVAKNKVYLAEYSKSRLKVLDAQSLKSLEMIELKFEPREVLANSSGDYIAIINPKAASLAAFNTKNAKQTKYFKTGKLTCEATFVDNHLYYISHDSREIGMIDCAQMRVILKEQTMCKPERFTIYDQFIYLMHRNLISPGPNLIEIYHLKTLKVIRQVPLDNNVKSVTFTNNGILTDGRLAFPLYPKTYSTDINYKDFCTFDLDKHPAPIDFQKLEDFKKSEMYQGLYENPGFLQSIAYDSFSAEKVLSMLENMDVETFPDLLAETRRVCDVAMWMDKAAPARKLFRWMTQIVTSPSSSSDSALNSSSSTSQTSSSSCSSSSSSTSTSSTSSTTETKKDNENTSSLFSLASWLGEKLYGCSSQLGQFMSMSSPSGECPSSSSCSSTSSTTETVHADEESTWLLSVNPFQDKARFPVSGVQSMGYKILVNHNAGTVTLDHVRSKEFVELKVGNFPTLILPFGPFVFVAVLGDKTLNENASIVVIDLTSRRIVDTLRLPKENNPDRLCMTKKGFYAMDTKTLNTQHYDTKTGKVSRINGPKGISSAGVKSNCDTFNLLDGAKISFMVSEEFLLKKLRDTTKNANDFTSIHHFYEMYLDDVGLTQEDLLAYGKKPL